MLGWWNWCNSTHGDYTLNARGLPWGPGDVKIQRLKGTPLFSDIKSLQYLTYSCAVVDAGADLRHMSANGLELSLPSGLLGQQALRRSSIPARYLFSSATLMTSASACAHRCSSRSHFASAALICAICRPSSARWSSAVTSRLATSSAMSSGCSNGFSTAFQTWRSTASAATEPRQTVSGSWGVRSELQQYHRRPFRTLPVIAWPPATDEGMSMGIPVCGRLLYGFTDVSPRHEAPPLECQCPQHYSPWFDKVQVRCIFRLEDELPTRKSTEFAVVRPA
jgi:hypothetical protein